MYYVSCIAHNYDEDNDGRVKAHYQLTVLYHGTIHSKCSRILNTFLFSNKMLVIRAGIDKCLSE